MSIEKIIEYGMFAAITGYLTWQKLASSKTRREDEAEREKERQLGLRPNPTRCGEHAEAIKELREEMADLRVGLAELRGDIKAHEAAHR